jgi:Holliday junction resolvase RusA-like endonuclease
MSVLAFSVPGKIIAAVRMPNKMKYSPQGQAYIGYKEVIAAKAREEIARLSTQTYQPWPIKPVKVGGKPARNVTVLVSAITDNHRADIDNVQKSLLDSCNKLVWIDDRQVGEIHATIRPLREGEEEVLIVTIVGDG